MKSLRSPPTSQSSTLSKRHSASWPSTSPAPSCNLRSSSAPTLQGESKPTNFWQYIYIGLHPFYPSRQRLIRRTTTPSFLRGSSSKMREASECLIPWWRPTYPISMWDLREGTCRSSALVGLHPLTRCAQCWWSFSLAGLWLGTMLRWSWLSLTS